MAFFMLVEEDRRKEFFIGTDEYEVIQGARHNIDRYPAFRDYTDDELIEAFETGEEEYTLFEVPLEYKDYTQEQLSSIYRHFFSGIIPTPLLKL